MKDFYTLRSQLENAFGGGRDMPRIMLTQWHPNAEQVFNVVDKLASDFALELQLNDHGFTVETRENSDVGEYEPGADDIAAVKAFARAVREQLPGIKMEDASVDEFVSVGFPYQRMDGLELAAAPANKAPKPSR